MDTDDHDTFTLTAPEYHAPTRDDWPELFAFLDWLATRESVMAPDNPHALCFSCKGQARVMTACLYEGAKDHECIWRGK